MSFKIPPLLRLGTKIGWYRPRSVIVNGRLDAEVINPFNRVVVPPMMGGFPISQITVKKQLALILSGNTLAAKGFLGMWLDDSLDEIGNKLSWSQWKQLATKRNDPEIGDMVEAVIQKYAGLPALEDLDTQPLETLLIVRFTGLVANRDCEPSRAREKAADILVEQYNQSAYTINDLARTMTNEDPAIAEGTMHTVLDLLYHLEQRVEKQQEEVDGTYIYSKGLEDKLTETETALAASQNNNTTLREQIDLLTIAIANFRKNQICAKTAIGDLKTQVADLTGQLDTATAQIARLQDNAGAQRNRHLALERDLRARLAKYEPDPTGDK